MKKNLITLMVAVSWLTSFQMTAQRKQLLDNDWQFSLNGSKEVVKDAGVAAQWRTLSLPHDWSVENEAASMAGGKVIGPFSTNSIGGYQTGFTVGGDGWYQKTLNLNKEDLEGKTIIYFEGAYNQSEVYVNGELCKENVYGYSSFRCDVTDFLKEGENNIVVHVANNGNNSRWYAGSGIYRHVWLMKTPNIHLDEWDTFLTTTDNNKLNLSTILHNESAYPGDVYVELALYDADGKEVATNKTENIKLDGNSDNDISLTMNVDGASTWSPESPYLYNAEIRLKDKNGENIDSFSKKVGFRTLSFDAKEGFLLNGEPTLLRGGCVHHDNGMLGAAAFNKAEERKLRLLKEQGYNAVRCSHNLPSEHFLDVCDEIGLMVIDECFDQWNIAKNSDDYHRYFREHSDEDLSVMLRRDRNHPSIIMWSIGNEIPGRISDEGMATAERLRKGVHKYDTTRPITAAICSWDDGDSWNAVGGNWDAQCDRAFQSLDVGGYNYLYDKYEYDHGRDPERVMCGLESYPKQASENWTLVEKHPYVIGDFVWTAMDYIGEAGIGAAYTNVQPSMFQSWPWYNGNCGDIDLIGKKKPQSYYRDVVWRQAPVTMAVQPTTSFNNAWGWQLEEQHWTWNGKEGEPMIINVYSRAPKVRLYLNGESLGDQTPGETFWTGYTVNYQPGELKVVNLDGAGNEIGGEEFVLKTTKPAVDVRIVYEDKELKADKGDLAYVILELVDEDGNVVTSDCSTQISVENSGVGNLIGCVTAAPDDMISFRSSKPTMFRGRALAIIQSEGVAGEVELKANIIEPTFTSLLLKNPEFDAGLSDWVINDSKFVRHVSGNLESGNICDYLEADAARVNGGENLAGLTITQSTKVLPEGDYTLSFDYVAESSDMQTGSNDPLKGLKVSIGGNYIELENTDPGKENKACLPFTLEKPMAITLRIDCEEETNAKRFAVDNFNLEFNGDYDFYSEYTDYSDKIPGFDGSGWKRQSGNESGSYTEVKLASDIYNGEGLAYWSPRAPKNSNFFSQELSELPEGFYGLAAYCAGNLWSSSDNDRNPQSGSHFFVKKGDGSQMSVPVTTATYGLYYLTFNIDEKEKFTIGMMADGDNGNNWAYLAGVTLVQLNKAKREEASINSPFISGSEFNRRDKGVYTLDGMKLAEDIKELKDYKGTVVVGNKVYLLK